MRDTLVDALGSKIRDFKLIPSRGGCFELKVDGTMVFSKLATGQFPNEEDMVAQLDRTAPQPAHS